MRADKDYQYPNPLIPSLLNPEPVQLFMATGQNPPVSCPSFSIPTAPLCYRRRISASSVSFFGWPAGYSSFLYCCRRMSNAPFNLDSGVNDWLFMLCHFDQRWESVLPSQHLMICAHLLNRGGKGVPSSGDPLIPGCALRSCNGTMRDCTAH